jgi:hypothetical protein
MVSLGPEDLVQCKFASLELQGYVSRFMVIGLTKVLDGCLEY